MYCSIVSFLWRVILLYCLLSYSFLLFPCTCVDGVEEEPSGSFGAPAELWTRAPCGAVHCPVHGDGRPRPVTHQTLCNRGELACPSPEPVSSLE